MKHINVGSPSDINPQQLDTTIVVNKLTGLTLISLISAYSGEDFGITSLNKTVKGFRTYLLKIKKGVLVKLYVDSGGYSIIVGEVPPYQINRCIETYHYVLEHSSDAFDFIFSLDVPFNAKHPSFNTREKIEACNRKSLIESVSLLKKNPALKEKFHFIYHFKTIEHYEIWQKLYSELGLGKYIKHRAIGGMVSLKEMAKIDFAPFIATAFQCLHDYKQSESFGEDFRVHFLGINVKYDRFMIALLEALFQRYLGDETQVIFTYDTVNYRIAGFHMQEVTDLVHGKLVSYRLDQVPYTLLQKVYLDEPFASRIREELRRKGQKERMENSLEITPLKVYSELMVDTYFEHQIKQHRLIDLIMESTNPFNFKAKLTPQINHIFDPHEHIVGKESSKSVQKSLSMLQHFHDWYINMPDNDNELDYLSRDFISQIDLAQMINDPAPENS